MTEVIAATEAFGDVFASELDVDAAGPRARVIVCGEEALDLATDVVEVAGLASGLARERVAVHRIALPDHGVTRCLDGFEQRRQALADLVGAHSGDQGETARNLVGVECFAQTLDVVSGGGRADLATDRVLDATHELDVGTVELTGALADPDHVGRAVVPLVGEAVLAGQGFFVAEKQCLVAGVEVDAVEALIVGRVDATGAHETQGAFDAVGELLVALALG